jgi:uncharacterized radical SAM superfamily Fe-S cluster-containing enzyme
MTINETPPTTAKVRKPLPFTVRVEPKLPVRLEDRLEKLAAPLRLLDEAAAIEHFQLEPQTQLLKTTISVCPACTTHAQAAVYASAGRVYLRKRCDTHGLTTALLENDARYYRLSNKDKWGRRYANEAIVTIPQFDTGCCGPGSSCAPGTPGGAADFSDQQSNKSCTVLVEITDACNLACRVCYADSKGDRLLPLDTFRAYLDRLLSIKGSLDSVQLIGGEATIHPQFWDMLAHLHADARIRKIYIATNGIELEKGDTAARLVPFKDKTLVLLQFDGADATTNRALRQANPFRVRERLLQKLDRLGVPMQLTMTLARGVSEREIAWVVRQGVKHRNVRLVAMLPAMFSGRYELAHDPLDRITLSDVIKGVATGLSASTRASDFVPIPCSHPNCGWTTLFARRFGLLFNIARHVDLDSVMNEVAYKTVLDKSQVQGIIGTGARRWWQQLMSRLGRRLVRPQDVFGIVVKPFMDRYTYDQDRISACCHHILDTHGQLLSFCEYNTRLRAVDSWQHLQKFAAEAPLKELSTEESVA